MRIGIDARLWNETGVGRYIRNLVWELAKQDTKHHFTLFVSKGNRDLGLGRRDRFDFVETDIKWHTVEEQLLFHQVIANEGLDLMHFPYFSIPILYNKPFVMTIHDLIINHFPTGKASTLPLPVYYAKRFGYQYILKQAAKNSQHIITVSEATKKEIVEHLKVSSSKVSVTYEGVDDGIRKLETDSGQARMTGLKSADKYLLYVGNAYPHKNVERLVDAFESIAKEFLEVKLVMVGKKNYFYDRVEEKVKELGLTKNVVFAGKVSDEELASLYQHAEALVFPSLMEGFGLPGLEAMQNDCLVLASDIPVFKEIYGESAVYFNPSDMASIRATIRQVLTEKKAFEKYHKKGQALVKTFSWEQMAKQTLKIYESSISLRQS